MLGITDWKSYDINLTCSKHYRKDLEALIDTFNMYQTLEFIYRSHQEMYK